MILKKLVTYLENRHDVSVNLYHHYANYESLSLKQHFAVYYVLCLQMISGKEGNSAIKTHTHSHTQY